MFGVTTSDDYQPVTWVGRHPVHVTTLLVAVHVFTAIVECFLGGAGILGHLAFDSALVWQRGEFWQLATYAFVHSPSALLWFAVEMYMLFVFGREVERFIGQRAYIALYLTLLLLPAAILTMWGLFARTGMAGSGPLHFAIFVAFATIYPNVELLLRIMAKWVALLLAGIGTLSALAAHDWQTLVVLWTSIGAAFLFVELRGAGPELAWLHNFKVCSRPRATPQAVQKSSTRRVVEPGDVYASADPILDKIAKSGIGSLTASERQALDRARNRLLKKSE